MIMALVFAGIAFGATFLVSKQYSASVLLSPVAGNSGDMGGAGSLLSEYKGLASLAGLNLTGNDKRAESIALLQSTVIAQRFILQNRLLPILYSKKWDARTKSWRAGEKAPTLWEATQYFKKKICDVTENARTGLVSLTVKWKNPEVAAQWANGVVALTNDYARQKAIGESDRDISFLNDQAAKTTVVEERSAIFSLLESVLNKKMLAEGTMEYALKVIDPAVAAEKPSFPQPMIWVIVGFFGGALVGCAYAVARSPGRRS